MKPYYEDGSVTLYHGDCREVLPHVERVACTVTSPPYNTLGSFAASKPSGMWSRSTGGAGFARSWAAGGYADTVPEAEYQADQMEVFRLVAAASTPDASLFYNHQARWRDGECIHPIQWFRPADWSLRQEIIWDRCGGMMMNARMFCRFDERILWFIRAGGAAWKWNQESVGHGTVWRVAREQTQQGKEHPVAYPQEIPARCIAATTDPGDVVLDPFAGSGSTLRAAKDMNRRAIGIEIEERYCEIAARRLSQEVLPFGESA